MELPRSTMKKLIFLIVLGALLFTAPQWIGKAGTVMKFVLGIMMPFLIGAGVAFILNVPMRFIESKLLCRLNRPGARKIPQGLIRAASLVLTFLFLVAVLLLVVLVVVPQLAVTIAGLGTTIQNAITHFLAWAQDMFSNNPEII